MTDKICAVRDKPVHGLPTPNMKTDKYIINKTEECKSVD